MDIELAGLSLGIIVKGIVSPHRYFFERSIKLHQYFLHMRQWFFKHYGWPVEENNIYIDFACFCENTLKLVPKTASEFLSGFLSLSLASFIQRSPLIGQRKSRPPNKHVMGGLVCETIFRITAGLRNKFYSNRRVSVCRNKLFEEGYWKDFKN